MAVVALLSSCSKRAPRTKTVLTVSPPRTVATLPGTGYLGPYGSLSCPDQNRLVLDYRFESCIMGSGRGARERSYVICGILRVDPRTGEGSVVRAPRPIGGSPQTIYQWSDRTDSGEWASVRLPPLRIGSGGAISFSQPQVCRANGRMAYVATIDGPSVPRATTTPETGIWISRGDGSQPVRVAAGPGKPVAWSRDGRILLFERGSRRANPELWICRSDGSGVRQLVGNAYWGQISPDSHHVAYTRDVGDKTSLYLISLGGGPSRLIATDAWLPAWVGRSVFFSAETKRTPHILPWRRYRIENLAQRIDAFDPATGQTTTIHEAGKNEGLYGIGPPATEAGLFVLAGCMPGEELAWWVCAVDGKRIHRTRLRGDIAQIAWSPDGRRLAYIENGEIKVVDVALKRVKRP